jgi:hypothetical protein
VLVQAVTTTPASVSPSPSSSTALTALFWVFAAFAVILTIVFLATGALAYRNRRRRGDLETIQRRKSRAASERKGILSVNPIPRDDNEDDSRGNEVKEPQRKGRSTETLTIGDLVRSTELREAYVQHARAARETGDVEAVQAPLDLSDD